MFTTEMLPGLQIRSAYVSPDHPNFRPTWPPTSDFPVVMDADGKIVSRYGDRMWRLAPWAGHPLSISFEAKDHRAGALCEVNAALLRRVDAWWLYGPRAVQAASSLAQRHVAIKPLFVVCTEEGIAASELWRFPKVIEKVASRLTKSEARKVFHQLHNLWGAREFIGFQILDQSGLALLANHLPTHEYTQTPYIPPRIWTYQVLRLKACIDDFLKHQQQVEACYTFCLDAYANNFGSLAKAFGPTKLWHAPFHVSMARGSTSKSAERRFYGRFIRTAEEFGIDGLLNRWTGINDSSSVKTLTHYLSLVSHAGLGYALNFSLMRIDEGYQLRTGCHLVERDNLGDDIHILSGPTSKTYQDDNAYWITSPSVSHAIEAMTSIARCRLRAAIHNPNVRLTEKDVAQPLLIQRAYEPWHATARSVMGNEVRRKRAIGYSQLLKDYPKLLDESELRITEADLAVSHQMNFGLDLGEFDLGKTWPLAWHQLRRTGACNMLSTGLVSETSLQYQLKHTSLGMTRYYGQNYYKLSVAVDKETREYFVRSMYDSLARDLAMLPDDRFVSPHGEKRKAQILESISEKDHKALLKDARSGRLSYRETFLGGCSLPGDPCPFGGISNLSNCMGFGAARPCEWVLLDKSKRERIEKLQNIFIDKLKNAPTGSPLRASLEASIESTERALHAISHK